MGASFIDQLGGVTLPAPAGKAAQNVPQQGLTTILSVSGILALLFPFIGGALGEHVVPESGKSAPTHHQEGTVKIRIEGPDTSSLGPTIPLSKRSSPKQGRSLLPSAYSSSSRRSRRALGTDSLCVEDSLTVGSPLTSSLRRS